MTKKLVLAVQPWPTNGFLMRDCMKLGYIKKSDDVLDATYGNGVWWKVWRPPFLTAHRGDFRHIPYDDDSFDVVAYDPPFVSPGGRSTTTIPAFYRRYGLKRTPKSPAELQKVINRGLDEMNRVVKPGGIILCKCKDYVSSGKLWIGTHWTLTHALDIGLVVQDRLERIGNPGPQPEKRNGKVVPQQHARRNLSTLFVFRKLRKRA